jgi:hypothetical protein
MRPLAGYAILLHLGAAAAAVPSIPVSRCAEPPVIDGRLDDPCWRSAAALDGFVQIRPGDNTPPSRDTSVLVAAGPEALYLAIRAADDPAEVRATVARRDAVLDDDHVALYLDTFDDRRRAYVLIFNPLGIQQDGVYAEGREIDYSVDLVMQSKGVVGDGGYTVEVALPWSSIRYPAGAGRRWGVHVQRRIRHLDEEDSWRPLVRGNAGLLAQAGTLEGLGDVRPARFVELIPGLTVARSGARSSVPPGRYETESAQTEPSLTVKLAPTPGVVLDATVHPDFAQIESDQLVSTANQRFPTYFAEKRPFFLEGIDIFRTPLEAVHSRTIVDPDYAAKVSGKSGRTTFATLLASDDAPGDLSAAERLDPGLARFAGRNAAAGVLRIRRDIGDESYLGVLATSRDFVDRRNRVGGFDGRLALDARNVLAFQVVGTWSEPAADGPSDEGLGFFAEWKRGGRHLSSTLRGEGRTPGYRADLGFTAQTDTDRWSFDLRYDSEPRPEAPLLLSWSVANTVLSQWDWDGRVKYGYLYPRLTLSFRRQTAVSVYLYADYLRLFEEEFGPRRGAGQAGAFFGRPERSTVYKGVVFDLQSKPAKQLSLALTVDRAWDTFDYDFGAPPRFRRVSPAALADPAAPLDPGTGRALSVTARLELQPSDSLRLTFDHSRNRLVRDDTGRVAFDERLSSTQATYQLTAFVFGRTRLDYDSLHRNVRGQLLLGWTPAPGTSLYAGYTDDLTRDPRLDGLDGTGRGGRIGPEWVRNGRTVFLKLSYLARFAWKPGKKS